MLRKPLLLLLLSYLWVTSLAQRGSSEDETSSKTTGTSYALVVGISSYPNINRLLYADDDAHAFADFLVNHGICEKNNVTKLIDSVATKANFYKELKKLMNKTVENDRVFIYFAGHGDVETDIESGFLLCYNSESSNYPATDAIDISMLERYVNAFVKKNSKVVLITDACRSGNLAGGLAGASTTISSITKGFQNVIKILSCQPNQLSEEKPYQGGGHGVFTYHLVDGLSGLADRDDDQFVTLRELDFYLDEVSRETNKKQIPKVDGDPQAQVVKYEAALKNLVLARKNNNATTASVASIKKRNVMDSAWSDNKYYIAFNDHLRKFELIEPAKSNAWTVLQDAIKFKQPGTLVEDMKLELAAVMEDEAQKWINKYLRGETATKTAIVLDELIKCKEYCSLIKKMIGKEDFRYQEIEAKEQFFAAYYYFQTNKRNHFGESIANLDNANKVLGEQAWLLHVQALLYSELNENHKAIEKDKAALKYAPRWRYAWNHLGTNYRTLKQFDKAFESYNVSLDLDSLHGITWNHIGIVYEDMNQIDKAIDCYKKAIALDPNELYAYSNLGNQFIDLKQYDSAAYYLRKFLEFDSTFSYGWERLGDYYYFNKKQNDKALDAYSKSVQSDSFNTYSWNGIGLIYENQKEYDKAEKYFLEAVKADSFNVSAWRNLGDIYLEYKDYAKAKEVLEKGLRMDSTSSELWNSLGIAYDYLDDLQTAEKYYQSAIQYDTTNSSAYNNLASIYIGKGDYSKAENMVRRSIAFDSTLISAWNNLGRIYRNRFKYPEALEYYTRAFKLDSTRITTLVNMGLTFESLGKYNQAESYYLAAARLDPNDKYVWANLATLSKTQNRLSEALNFYKKAIDIDPEYVYAWYNMALTYQQDKNHIKAENAFLKTIALEPQHAYAKHQLGHEYFDQQYYPEAANYYEQAIQILPDISHFWDTMLETVDHLKEFNDVFDWFNKMNRKLIDNKTFRTQLAYKLLKQKEFDEAEKHFLKAMDFANEDPWTSYNLACLYALWNKKDQALKHFEDALTKGFDDFDHINKDTDLDSIRNESMFKKLVEKFRK